MNEEYLKPKLVPDISDQDVKEMYKLEREAKKEAARREKEESNA